MRPRVIGVEEFARRLLDMVQEPDCSIVWFLGAGCSVSSGVPAAGELVEQWLPRLKRLEDGAGDGWEAWAKDRFPDFDPDSPQMFYGALIDELFPLPRERQQEIERLTARKDPAVGYALLAVLMAHSVYGDRSNVVLTTNFDDLMADALYLLTRKKPLVVVHDSLAPFVRRSQSRPLIVKVHGDARLVPRSTPDETNVLDEELQQRITSLMPGCALVFCGYGGNDHSIARLIRSAPPDAFPLGLYWVGETVPVGPVGAALLQRAGVFHVEHFDFDALMLTIAGVFDLGLPEVNRFTALFDGYRAALAGREAKGGEPAEGAENQAVRRIRGSLDATKLVNEARALMDVNPGQADELFKKALDVDPDNVYALNSYATFLHTVRHDYDRAEENYRRVLKVDPADVPALSNYAVFLKSVRRDYEGAEEHYRRALESDPADAIVLSNYAGFLKSVRRDYEGAEEHYRRALEANPGSAVALSKYAAFLYSIRRDYEGAEEHYRRALEADPSNADALANYAQFLFERHRDGKATELLSEALERSHGSDALTLELGFYLYAHVPTRRDEGLRKVRSLLETGVRSVGWDLSGSVQRAEEGSDPRAPFLAVLAQVIAGEAPIETLDEFEEWRSGAGR